MMAEQAEEERKTSNDVPEQKSDRFGRLDEISAHSSDSQNYSNRWTSERNSCISSLDIFSVPNREITEEPFYSPLSELRNIADRELRSLQPGNAFGEEEFFDPPHSPRRSPIDYLKELARAEVYKMLRKKLKNSIDAAEERKTLALHPESSPTDVKCFNDFDEGLFEFNPTTQRYECPYQGCTKAFPSLSRIKRHFIIHTDIKPFKCVNEECHRTFSRRDNMLQHYRMHCPFTQSK